MKYSDLDFSKICKSLLEDNLSVEFRAYGGSMRPFIRSGDLLTITPVNIKTIRIGDIIAHKTTEHKLLIHRVISARNTNKGISLSTKGDAEFSRNISVQEPELLGKVVLLKRQGHKIRLEGKRAELVNLFWLHISRLNIIFYPPMRFLKKAGGFIIKRLILFLQSFQLYRLFAAKIFINSIDYSISEENDALSLAYLFGYDKFADFQKRVGYLKEQISEQASNNYFLIAKRKGKVVGSISISEEEGPCHGIWRIDGLFVHILFRGRGIAEMLINQACCKAIENKAACVRLYVFENLKPALKLYKKLGFERVSIAKIDSVFKQEAEGNKPKRIILEKNLETENIIKKNDSSADEKIETILAYFAVLRKIEIKEHDRIIELVSSEFDWNYFFEKAQKEGLAPIIYKRMLGDETIKAIAGRTVYAKFKNAYYAAARSNMLMLEFMRNILNAFQYKGIRTLLLKGIMLAEFVYKDIGLRPMGDIDILIRKADMLKVDKVLKKFGYSAGGHFKSYLENEQVISINSLMYNDADHLHPPIHVHWHLINSTRPLNLWVNSIDMREIWDKAELINIQGIRFFILSPEHLLIYLSLHALTHGFDRLILAVDIAEVLHNYKDKIDLSVLRSTCEQYCASEILYYCLSYVRNRLNIRIKEVELIEMQSAGFWKKRLDKMFLNNIRGYKVSYLTHLLMHRQLKAKICFVWKTVFPAKLILANSLNISPDHISWRNYCRRVFAKFPRVLKR